MSEWQTFFDGHAPIYDTNCFTSATLAEVGFLLERLELPPGAAILDIGCGTGRHSIELAKRGYAVTGIDLSQGMLEQARAKADAAGVNVQWRQADATAFAVDEPFDAAICLCEGAFGLLGSQDDPIGQPLAILHNVESALKPGGRFLLTALSAFRMIRLHPEEDVAAGCFDPLTLSEASDCGFLGHDGSNPLRERGFVPSELAMLYGLAGLEVMNIWGGTAGDWGMRPIKLDEYEIMVRARKPVEAAPTDDILKASIRNVWRARIEER